MDFSVPSGWQNTTSSLSRSERRQLALDAAQELQAHVVPELGAPSSFSTATTAANMVVVMASQDQLNGSDLWQGQINSTLGKFESGVVQYASTNYMIDKTYFGLAEVDAYLAYKDVNRLNAAVELWNLGRTAFIASGDAQSGNFPRPLNTTCGTSLGGAVFDFIAPSTGTGVHSNSISVWIALSARLAEITGNATYLNAAELSIQFMQTNILNLNNVTGLVAGTYDVTSCTPSTGMFTTWDVGPYIEGLSVVANFTGNDSYTQSLADIIPKIVTVPEWHTEQGVIRENLTDYRKGTIIRAFLETRRRNPENAAMVNLIDSYITVQLNAVLTNARTPGSDDYRTSWAGGGPVGFDTAGSVEALDVLNAAFAIAPRTNDDQPGSVVPSAPGSSTGVPVGAIVGGVLGGVFVLVSLALGLFLWLRRRRRAHQMSVGESKHNAPAPGLQHTIAMPFTATAPVYVHPQHSMSAKGRPFLSTVPSANGASGSSSYVSSSMTAPTAVTTDANNMAAASDAPTLATLARRLDTLFDVLARRGDVDPPGHSPPRYEARLQDDRV